MINVLSILVILLYVARFNIQCFGNIHEIKITKCLKQPDTWKKVEKAVKECQEDVKLNIIKDAFQSVNDEWIDSIFDHEDHNSFNHYEDEHHHSISQPSTTDTDPHLFHDNDPVHHNYPAVHDHHPTVDDHHNIAQIHNNHPSVHAHLIHEHSSYRNHQPSINDQQLSIRDIAHSLTHGHHSSVQNTNDHHHSTPDHFDSHTVMYDHPLPHHGHSHTEHLNENHVTCHNKHRHFKVPQHLASSGHHTAQSNIYHTGEHIQHTDTLSDTPIEHHQHIDFNDFRKKRDASNHHYIHPSTVTYRDKRIAGCIMQCIFEKNHAVDKLGWPTLDGLVNFYSEGVNEHGYFMATLRAVDYCLKASSAKYHVNRRSTPEKGQTCDVAFDVFDCISDRITEYCSEHHHT